MRIAIRVDASLQTGTGHVMRCLALAEALRGQATVEFVCREWPGHLCDVVVARGYAVHRLACPADEAPRGPLAHSHWLGVPQEDDARETLAALAGAAVDWVVVDHYGIDAAWESPISAAGFRILAVDDLADRVHECDIILDQNLGADAGDRYVGKIPPRCRPLLGPRYALLRPEFARLRPRAALRTSVGKVLVFFGGVDLDNFTAKVIAALRPAIEGGLAVTAVAGSRNPHLAELRALCRETRCELHVDTPNLGELMLDADLAIGAGGTTQWERACLGLPSIVVPVAANQVDVARRLADSGAALLLDAASVTESGVCSIVQALRSAPRWLEFMSRRSMEIADGQGAERVAGIVLRRPVRLRGAIPADRDRIYEWRNAETVRRVSHDSRPIEKAAHDAWFSASLKSDRRDLLISEVEGEPMGVLRFDRDGDGAVVSIYLAPHWHGGGYGTAVLEAGHIWLAANRPDVRQITAEVLAHNRASDRMFQQAGYRLQSLHYLREMRK